MIFYNDLFVCFFYIFYTRVNRNNINNLCDTSHMVFVDGDDPIDEYSFDSIRENIDKYKDKENSFILVFRLRSLRIPR